MQVFRQMNAKNLSNSRALRKPTHDRERPSAPSLGQRRAQISNERTRAPSAHEQAPAAPLAAFTASAEARAMLYAACEIDLHEAVDPTQALAVELGLVDQIGQDGVQAIMAAAFEWVRQ
jgi:hypothetical protein